MFSKRLLIALGFVTLTAAALAQNSSAPATLSVRGQHAVMTIVTEARAPITRTNLNPSGLVTIFNNIAAKYPKGLYWCCSGYNVMGSNSGVGEQWMAAAFTPNANHTVTRIAVAVGYSQQGTNGVVISLNDDNNGVPGQVLKQWSATGLPRFGDCCGLVVESDSAGIPITGGQQYWVVLSTNSKESDTVDAWNVDDTDQIDSATVASFTGTQWTVFQTTPGLAFAVLGSN